MRNKYKKQRRGRNYVEAMSRKQAEELKELSQKAFGASSRYKTIMRRGRVTVDLLGDLIKTEIITAQEIKDTMLFIIDKQKKATEEMNERLRSKENEQQRSDGTQPGGGDAPTGASKEDGSGS